VLTLGVQQNYICWTSFNLDFWYHLMFITSVVRMWCQWANLVIKLHIYFYGEYFYCWTEYYRVGRVADCCAILLLPVKKYSIHCVALLRCYMTLIV